MRRVAIKKIPKDFGRANEFSNSFARELRNLYSNVRKITEEAKSARAMQEEADGHCPFLLTLYDAYVERNPTNLCLVRACQACGKTHVSFHALAHPHPFSPPLFQGARIHGGWIPRAAHAAATRRLSRRRLRAGSLPQCLEGKLVYYSLSFLSSLLLISDFPSALSSRACNTCTGANTCTKTSSPATSF